MKKEKALIGARIKRLGYIDQVKITEKQSEYIKHLGDKIFTIVDVETTGGSSNYDRIIEIGILRIENGKVVETFNTLVNPECGLSPYITSITGINAAELETAPTFDEIKEKIQDLFEGAVLVAHNARFDYGFIRNEFKRAGISFQAKCLCTVRLSRKMFSRYKRHDLSTIIERYGFTCENRHRAYDDAAVLWDFMRYICDLDRGEELSTTINQLLKQNSLPQLLDERSIKNLPLGPGVYIFYGPEGEVLYVGKSINIRDRVLSHFSNDHASSKEMHLCQQTKRIETRVTAGELGALLLESQLIKELCPLYNRQLRRTSLLVIAKKTEVNGYASVTLERVNEITKEDYGTVMGVFRSVSQAKEFISDICAELGLCKKILGIEKGKGICFSYQIGKCTGACANTASKDEFNQLFFQAFDDRKLKSWIYDGPVVIEEKGEIGTHSFILDNWCLIGDCKTSSEDQEATPIPAFYPAMFDYDAYKIFARYILDKSNIKKIKHIDQVAIDELYAIESEGEEIIYI